MRNQVFAFVLCSCMNGGYSMREKVTDAAREYNEGVRWGRLEQAVTHVPTEMRDRFIARHRELADELEISDYEVLSLTVDKPNRRAVAQVEYNWSLKRRGILHKTATQQTWVSKDGDWIVEKEVRVSGTPLVLFEEPPAPNLN